MKHLDYAPQTPELLSRLPCITKKTVQEYLRACFELGQMTASRNILRLPNSASVNPYATLLHWLENTNFELAGTPLSASDQELLRKYAAMPPRTLRQEVEDSTQLDCKFTHEYLQHFSQIYAINELLNSLHVYNFFVRNYIHETINAGQAIQKDHQECLTRPWGIPRNLLRLWLDNCPAKSKYERWVREPFLNATVKSGSGYFSRIYSFITDISYQSWHPLIDLRQLSVLASVNEANTKLAHSLRHYRYYRWFAITPAEQSLIHEIRNSSYLPREIFLFSHGQEYLERAVKLAGQINYPVVGL